MDPLDSQTQSGEGSRETSEVFDSVFDFLMDFANKAETTVRQPKRTALVDDDTANEVHEEEEEEEEPPEEEEEEEEEEEDWGDGNARELFDKFPAREKEMLLMEAFSTIVGNMLDKLPEDGKEPFLARCFDGLFPKLPPESWRAIAFKVERLRPVPYIFNVRHPPTIGRPRRPPGPRQPPPGPQQPPPGPQQPPPGPRQPPPGPRHPPGPRQPPHGTGPQQPPPGPTA